MPEKIPTILQAAWSVTTPREQPLVDQVVPVERAFLIKFAEYLTEVYPDNQAMDFDAKEALLKEIMATAYSRIAVLAKEVNPSLTHAVIAVVLYLLSNILSNEHVKYKTQGAMLEAYPDFATRSDIEKQNLFLTANWMNVLFRIIPARKNKGIAMDIIPKFVEGNGAHYVTGGGQTQSTRDRVFIYETEGDCKPIKRLKRKSKLKLEEERLARELQQEEEQPRKKAALSISSSDNNDKRTSQSSNDNLYYPLPAPFFQALPLPIPVISPRSQSSFSQAATVIANFGQVESLSSTSSANSDTTNEDKSSNYIVSPRECYLDIDTDGTVVKKLSPRAFSTCSSTATSLSLLSTQANKRSLVEDTSKPLPFPRSGRVASPPPPQVARMSSTSSTFDKFVEAITSVDDLPCDQLAMLREASADSDI